MFRRAIKNCQINTIAKRLYCACPRPVGMTAEVETITLDNNVFLASTESSVPISRVAIVFRAGSRFELHDTRGCAHMLSLSAGLSNKKSSAFGLMRNIQQHGGTLSATTGRECVSYTLTCTSNHINKLLGYLHHVIQPIFKPWELTKSLGRVDCHSCVDAKRCVYEMVHQAAFRSGLGNSVIIPKYQIGKLSSETMQKYFDTYCTASRCAVVAIGVDPDIICGFAKKLELKSDSGEIKTGTCTYYVGDQRLETGCDETYVAVAFQTGGLITPKEVITIRILETIVGNNSSIKRGNNLGCFGSTLEELKKKGPIKFRGLRATYSDGGLLGFIVAADGQRIGQAVENLTRAFKSIKITKEEVERAKFVLEREFSDDFASDQILMRRMGCTALIMKRFPSVEELLCNIYSITHEEVMESAKKIGSSKLSMGAIGNLATVPYAVDCCC